MTAMKLQYMSHLGSSPTANVIKLRSTTHDRLLAMKIIRGELTKDNTAGVTDTFAKRMDLEDKICKKLSQHPNIVNTYQHLIHEGRPRAVDGFCRRGQSPPIYEAGNPLFSAHVEPGGPTVQRGGLCQ